MKEDFLQCFCWKIIKSPLPHTYWDKNLFATKNICFLSLMPKKLETKENSNLHFLQEPYSLRILYPDGGDFIKIKLENEYWLRDEELPISVMSSCLGLVSAVWSYHHLCYLVWAFLWEINNGIDPVYGGKWTSPCSFISFLKFLQRAKSKAIRIN